MGGFVVESSDDLTSDHPEAVHVSEIGLGCQSPLLHVSHERTQLGNEAFADRDVLGQASPAFRLSVHRVKQALRLGR